MKLEDIFRWARRGVADAANEMDITFEERDKLLDELESHEKSAQSGIDYLKEQLADCGHEAMRAALLEQVALGNVAFVWEMLYRWRTASADDRLDIESFYESDGPEKVRQAQAKVEDGVPTAADLVASSWKCPTCRAEWPMSVSYCRGCGPTEYGDEA